MADGSFMTQQKDPKALLLAPTEPSDCPPEALPKAPTPPVGPPAISESMAMEVCSNSPGVSGTVAGDCLHGLKFGKKIYFEDGGGSTTKEAPSPAPSAAATAPLAKRGKGAVHGAQQPPRCQVEGCEADLTGAKTYYCRHKVCGMHSKAPKVIVAGLEQRFCQQCSRFHQLPEFDQGKRSCRRRLAGHNERRRKPPPAPFASRFTRYSSSCQEEPARLRSFLVDFSYPRISSATRDVWPVQPVDPGTTNQYLGILYPPCNAAVVHGVHPCMHGLAEWPVYSLPERPSSDSLAGVSDSSCALSLLSTQPWNSNTRNRASTMISASISGTLTAHPTIINSSMPNSCSCCTSRRGKTSSQNVHRGVVLDGTAEVGDRQLSGELELALQGNGLCTGRGCSSRAAAYHEPEHAMHWSL